MREFKEEGKKRKAETREWKADNGYKDQKRNMQAQVFRNKGLGLQAEGYKTGL